MKRKIINPFIGIEGYNCFGCAPHNRSGLRMDFFEDGNAVIAEWSPEDHFQGYGNVLHGGVAASLMDEVAAWVVFIKLETAGLTSDLQIRYLKPAYTNRGILRIEGRIRLDEGKNVRIDTLLLNPDGEICSEAEVTYRVFPQKLAMKKLYYPGLEAFFSEKEDNCTKYNR